MLKKFWQNLGINYQVIQSLPHPMVEMFNDMMYIEEQYQEKREKGQIQNVKNKVK